MSRPGPAGAGPVTAAPAGAGPATAAPAGAGASTPSPRRTRARAYVVWSVGVLAYVIAVFNRTSLGVAGPAALERFSTGTAVLSVFAVVQLVVYAGMQVPVGVLVDRFGTKRLLVAGATAMVAGQAVLAVVTDVPGAFAGRVLVGLGDAMTFISVLRLVPAWFAASRVPVLTQVTGILGQLGQVLSAIPLAAVLAGPGWSVAFGGAAGVGALVAVLVLVVLRDAPPDVAVVRRRRAPAEVRGDLVGAWREPGTRLGFWCHFTSQFSGMVFALLWGYPFMVQGLGLTPVEAGAMLTLLVAGGIATGPVVGRLTALHPLRRSYLVLGIIGTTALAWTVVLAWPGEAPLGLVAVLVLVLSVNGPGSMVGFDFARTYNPPDRLGTATGVVNTGGFTASLLTILGIGVVLDLLAGDAVPALGDFRAAFGLQYLVWGFGVVMIVRTRRLAWRDLRERGVDVLPLARVWRSRPLWRA
ncbi:nitrate/nitrite transporter [uncultured Pseudokineococcus sp.]|uniref:MFS transporter n=1 Tax=uncultured Pseudokineococcus sp. TaxID=1642928 RepID=UPI0026074DCD|nr:MFS transporter [uncultured Pseudokineococcus sp.]